MPDGNGVYVGSLDVKPEEQSATKLLTTMFGTLVPFTDSVPAARRGQLLFRREGTLMAQPFDDQRLVLSGEPVPVAAQLGTFLANGLFSASTNGVLVYPNGRNLSELTADVVGSARDGSRQFGGTGFLRQPDALAGRRASGGRPARCPDGGSGYLAARFRAGHRHALHVRSKLRELARLVS